MSQVRKLLNGEKIPKHKYGHLIIDGIDHGNSEDVYKQFAQHAKLQDSGQGAAYSAWLQQLANGEDVILGADNSSNVKPEGMSDKTAGQRSWSRKIIDDVFNTNRNQYSDAITTARRFTPIIQPKKKTSQNNSASNFVFTGETPKYSENDANNLALRERFDTYLNWLSDELWEEDNQFSTALTENQKSALKAWYNNLAGENPYEKRQNAIKQWNEYIGKVKAAENGYDSVDEDTRNFFANFNIGNSASSAASNSTSNENSTADEKKVRKLLKDAGYNEDLYKILGGDIEIDNEGTLRSKSGAFDLGTNGNIYFNSDFYTTPTGASGQYDPLRGLTLYNGALYKNNSARLAQILNASGGFNEAIKNGNFDLADSMIQTRFSDARKENPGTLSEDSYSQFLTPGHRFSNLTGLYGLKNGTLGDGEQIVQYFDLNDTFNDGAYLDHNYNYGIFDSHGNKIRDISMNDLQRIQGGQSAGALNTWKRTTVNSGPYKNKYYEDITGRNGQPSGIRIYRDINNPNEDVILHIDDSDWRVGAGKGHDIKLPKEIAQILMADQSWVDKIVKDSNARMKFGKAMSSLVQDRTGRIVREILGATGAIGPYDLIFNRSGGDKDYHYSALKELGLSKEQTKALQQALINSSKGNKRQRRDDYLLETPEFKQGGKVAYITKLASGGLAGGTKGSQGVSERRVDAKIHDPRNASSLGDIGSDNWTDADTKDLLALVGDVGSLGLAFVPGANIASTATGVAGSLARYSADRDRGTKGAGWQLALNLGMDAATLLPFLGGAAKSGKLLKGAKASGELMKKAARVVITGASAWGLGSAIVNSATKIANGEKFTVRDVSNVVNGITAGVGIAKSGGFGKSKTKTKVAEEIKLKSNDGTSELVISPEQAERITDPDELFDALFNKAKEGNASLTKEQFAEKFNVDSLLTKVTSWKPGWKPKDWFRKKESKTFSPKLKVKEVNVEANGNWLHDWWYRTGGYRQMYNQRLVGENIPDEVTVTRTTNKTTGRTYNFKIGDKKISLTPAEVKDIKTTPTMEQLNKFSTLIRGKDSSVTDEQIVAAFRKVLSSEAKGFKFSPRGKSIPVVEHTTVGEIPGWYRGRTTDYVRTTSANGKRATSTRTRVYDTRQGIARPNIILPLQLSGYSYDDVPEITYNPMYKKGGVLKAQYGAITPEEQKFIDEQFNNSLISNIEDSTIPNAWKRRYIGQLREQNPTRITGQYGDNNIDTSGWLEQIWKKGLGVGEYIAKARGRRNVADIQKKGLLDAYYQDPYITLQRYDHRDPQFEAEIQALNQQNANPSVNPNADYRAYVAGLLGKQAQILSAKNNVYRQAAQREMQLNNADLEIGKQETLANHEIGKENNARRSGLHMNLAQVDAGLAMQDAMSLANAIREERANTESQLEKAKQFAYNRAARDLDDRYEKAWNSRLGDKYSEWMNLDSTTKDNYSDINDWLQRAEANKGLWSTYENAWNEHQNSLNREREKLYMKYGLNPTAQMLYRQRYLKKGGRVGRNRYKNEPEEDVWINQNKAVHKAVAKLNDNIIKIFLKTLG